MPKQVTTVTLKDGTERVYESYPIEDYEALFQELTRYKCAWDAVATQIMRNPEVNTNARLIEITKEWIDYLKGGMK